MENANAYLESSKEIQTPVVQKLIKMINIKPGDTCIDLGCGTGNGSVLISENVGSNGKVLAIDPDASRIKVANEMNLKGNICYINDTLINSNIVDSSVDCAISNFVLHWICEKQETFEALFAVLKKGSLFSFTTPSHINQNLQEMIKYLPEDEKRKIQSRLFYEKESFYRDLAKSIGFEVVSMCCEKIELSFKTFSEYLVWIEASFCIKPSIYLVGKHDILKIQKNEDGYCIHTTYVITGVLKK